MLAVRGTHRSHKSRNTRCLARLPMAPSSALFPTLRFRSESVARVRIVGQIRRVLVTRSTRRSESNHLVFTHRCGAAGLVWARQRAMVGLV
jgi:hypothetical protein